MHTKKKNNVGMKLHDPFLCNLNYLPCNLKVCCVSIVSSGKENLTGPLIRCSQSYLVRWFSCRKTVCCFQFLLTGSASRLPALDTGCGKSDEELHLTMK